MAVSTWGMRRVIDVGRGLARWYYRRKYGTLARRMGRSGLVPGSRRGFIIIQIDGLSYDYLRQGMRSGYAPYLARLVSEGRLSLRAWNCGLPSTTPAVQAAIMFGNQDDVPGFRWYEKEHGLAVVAKRPAQVRAMQERLRGKQGGILVGGSSYVNMFDGDADLALFTMSALSPRHFFESVRGVGLMMLFVLSPLRVFRVFNRTVSGYLRALRWRFASLLHRNVFKPYDLLSPMMSAAINALFAEVQTFGVIMDIYRRVPSVYANYNTYDEVAHHIGPTHRAAFAALRDIDRRIRQIDRMRRRYRGREYDLYVLSDHGNAPAEPFSWRNKQSLGQFIVAQLGEQVSLDEFFARPEHALAKAHYLLDEVRDLEERVPVTVRRALRGRRALFSMTRVFARPFAGRA